MFGQSNRALSMLICPVCNVDFTFQLLISFVCVCFSVFSLACLCLHACVVALVYDAKTELPDFSFPPFLEYGSAPRFS